MAAFFSLSGFLVAGSLERSRTLINFLGLRLLRIVPALAAEVMLSALVLGPLLTTVPLAAYFGDPRTHAYFLNMLGDIHYRLPGVFEHNPAGPSVNQQLWAIPFELECYITLAVMSVLTLTRRRWLFLAVVAAMQVAWALRYMQVRHWAVVPHLGPADGHEQVICFLAGIALYLFRDRVIWSAPLALACAVLAFLSGLNGDAGLFLPAPIAYLTVYLGLTNPRKSSLLASGDYSYGIYLFGLPIQQTVASFGPWAQHVWATLLLAGPATAAIAALSWHGLEKHALKLRPWLLKLEDGYLAMVQRIGEGWRRGLAGAAPEGAGEG